MKKNNKQLYEKIMRDISREIKHTLNEDIQHFDVSEYDDSEIVDHQNIREITKTKNVDNTTFDWLVKTLEYLQYNHDYNDEKLFGHHLLTDIEKVICQNIDEILKYDEYTIGELVKQAIQKGSKVNLRPIKKKFKLWLADTYGGSKEEIEDWALDQNRTFEDVIQQINDEIGDFIQDDMSKRAIQILKNDNNNQSFKKWIDEFYS